MSAWRELVSGRPGSRFVDHHERAGKRSTALSALGGAVFVLLGLVLGFTPGPGFVFVLIGAAMLAARSRALARALDRFATFLRIRVRRWRG